VGVSPRAPEGGGGSPRPAVGDRRGETVGRETGRRGVARADAGAREPRRAIDAGADGGVGVGAARVATTRGRAAAAAVGDAALGQRVYAASPGAAAAPGGCADRPSRNS